MRKKVFALLLAVLLLAGCGEKKESRDSVSIWYVEGECPDAFTILTEQYNAELQEGLLPVSLRSFEDEESLAAAFDASPPDLLLCSYMKAEDLYQRERLRSAGISVAYPDYLKERLPFVGESFFPIGFEVQLFCCKEGSFTSADLRSPETLLKRLKELSKDGLPSMSADSFSELFCLWMLSAGTELHGIREVDALQDNYIFIFNLLAEAAYEGALVSMEGYDCVELVSGGWIPAAAVNSLSLAGEDWEGLEFFALPRYRDALSVPAECPGLAVCIREGRSAKSLSAFLSWLTQSERAAKLSLESGLVPAVSGDCEADNAAKRLLKDMAENFEAYLPYAGSDYALNRESFEKELRKAVDSLNCS